MGYVYKDLTREGFLKIPVRRRVHNKLLPNQKQRLGAVVEYYYHPESEVFEAQYFCSPWVKWLLILFMFVPAVVVQGVPNTYRDAIDLLYERKLGKFSSDRWFLKSDKTTDGLLERYIHNYLLAKGCGYDR